MGNKPIANKIGNVNSVYGARCVIKSNNGYCQSHQTNHKEQKKVESE